jgi:phosphoglycerate dehydrogenase-like enzyme
MKIALLDDYAGLSQKLADWSRVRAKATVEVFERALAVPDEAARVLAPFEVLCLIRERMPMPRALIERLPNLKMIVTTGAQSDTLDAQAATERGVLICESPNHPGTPSGSHELTWGLVLASVRHIPYEDKRLHEGLWMGSSGFALKGRTLGILGLGRNGKRVAGFGQAFGMKVVAWSQNLTAEAASAVGVTRVEKDELFRISDVICIHLVLSERTTGLVGAREFSLMKPHAHLINTSRGPIVDQTALIDALKNRRIGGAAQDVFDQEPLPADHPLRLLDNIVLTPHLGYSIVEPMTDFYKDTAEALEAYVNGKPIRILNPDALKNRRG